MSDVPSSPSGDDAAVRADGDGSPAGESEGSLRRKIGLVASASALALVVGELVTLAQVVALARLLTPAEVGIFTAGTVLTTALFDFVEGGLRAALVQRGGRIDDAAETVFRATLLSGAVLCGGVLAIAPVVSMVFDDQTVGLVAAATSGTLLLFALTNVPEAMLQRDFNVRRRIIVGPAVSLTFATVAVTLAACGWGVWSMVVGSYASTLVWVVGVWWISGWRPGRGRFDFTLWRELAKFGSPLVASQVGFRVKGIAEAVIVGRSLGAAELGQYRYAQRIAQIPERIIVDVGAVALFPAFSRIAHDATRMRSGYLRALQWAMIGGAPLTAMMIVLGEPAVVVILGEPWRHAGHAVAAMAGLGIGRALGIVGEEAIKGAGRTSLLNWCTATEVGVGIALALALVGPLGLTGVALAISITTILVALIVAKLAKQVVDVPYRSVARALFPSLLAATAAALVTAYLEHAVVHANSTTGAAAIGLLALDVLVFSSAYVGALFLLAPSTMRQLAGVGIAKVKQTVGRP
ncbi:lipopolysaccharide biosynthesis protein [Mycolicibacterium lacusdiani]|jgi:PST family polysaccharide transporter|uniref:lipopolysaccharide biosynthesis protein n=1 Tax=Mycolicibacterium lacusdiani TaxID=2895283 RepID=UPI001F2288BE|nr:lipopolysaccharide biosynthesis protein [Mycolicibacterium lacusdiani]